MNIVYKILIIILIISFITGIVITLIENKKKKIEQLKKDEENKIVVEDNPEDIIENEISEISSHNSKEEDVVVNTIPVVEDVLINNNVVAPEELFTVEDGLTDKNVPSSVELHEDGALEDILPVRHPGKVINSVAIEELDFLDETVKMDSKNLKIEDNNNDKSNENDYNVPKIISVIDGDMQ